MQRRQKQLRTVSKNDFRALSHGLGLGKPVALSLLKSDKLWHSRSDPNNPFQSGGRKASKDKNESLIESRSGSVTQKAKPSRPDDVAFISSKFWKLKKIWGTSPAKGSTLNKVEKRTLISGIRAPFISKLKVLTCDFVMVLALVLGCVYVVGSIAHQGFELAMIKSAMSSLALTPSATRLIALGLGGIYIIYLCYFGLFRLLAGMTLGERFFMERKAPSKTLDDQQLVKENS